MNVLKDGTMANSLKYQTDIDLLNIIIIYPTMSLCNYARKLFLM